MSHQALVKKANQYLSAHRREVNAATYPRFHLAAPYGWINDPNGFCHALGQYHMFYQHYPYDAQWGPMHWGHAVSTDLVNWHHCPVALAPSEDYDKDGCFSGSAIEHEGKLYLIYTGHVWLGKAGDDSAIREVQCLASSEDGIIFKKEGVIIEPPEGIMHFRDPKVWREGSDFYLVLGARLQETDTAQILKYRSKDLKKWECMGPVMTAPQGEAFMYECPDVFPLDGKFAAALSPMGLKPDGIERNNPSITAMTTSDDQNHFDPQGLFEIDCGHDFYATQTALAPDGRRIMTAWLAMWKLPFRSYRDNWCGSLIIPRELSLKDGKLFQKPVQEFYQKLLGAKQEFGTVSVENGSFNLCSKFKCRYASFTLDLNGAENAGVRLGDALVFYADRQHGELSLLRLDKKLFGARSVKVDLSVPHKIEMIIDQSSVEIFVDDGLHAFTAAFYSKRRDKLDLYASNGTAKFDQVTLCKVKECQKKRSFDF